MMAVAQCLHRSFDHMLRRFEVRLADPEIDDAPSLTGEILSAREHLERGFGAQVI
jgi:hypothetical protein